MFTSPVVFRLVGVASVLLCTFASAADVRVIKRDAEPKISGKEVDWIYGDYLLKNDQISVIIAAPLATRDANLTVKSIGGSILDLTLNSPSNDQLSSFTREVAVICFMIQRKCKSAATATPCTGSVGHLGQSQRMAPRQPCGMNWRTGTLT